MNKPTPGPWKYIGAEFCKRKRGLIIVDNEEGDCIAILQQPMPWSSALEQYEANADLIVAAVNACFAINPSNPQAVAEALPEIVAALRTARPFLEDTVKRPRNNASAQRVGADAEDALVAVRSALAKLGAK